MGLLEASNNDVIGQKGTALNCTVQEFLKILDSRL